MNLASYTRQAQAILAESQKIAKSRQHQAIEPEHLLRALLGHDEAKAVLEKLGVNLSDLARRLEVELTRLPRIAGASTYLSQNFLKATAAAEVACTG